MKKVTSPGEAWLIALGLAIALLFACAPAAREVAPGAPPSKPGAPAAKETPKYGGIFQYAGQQAATSLNWCKAVTVGEKIVLYPMFENLLDFEYKFTDGKLEDYRIDFKLVPLLAESWTQPDPATYILKLRQGVKWHDGVEFTADDVVWSFQYLAKPSCMYASLLREMKSVEALDKYAVKFTLVAPSAEFFQAISEGYIRPMAKHIFDRGDDPEKVVVGTGPYKLKLYDKDSKAVYVRNEDYWGRDAQGNKLPYMDGIKTIFGMDRSATTAGFIAREIDIYNFRDKPEWDPVSAVVRDARWQPLISVYGNAILFNTLKSPFNDIRVRKAVDLAIDRQAMKKALTADLGVINPPAITAAKVGYAIPEQELATWPGFRQPKDQDLAEAKRLLAEAGFPSGFKSSIKFVKTFTTQPPIVEMIATDLKKIGIDGVPMPLDQGMWGEAEKKGDYEMLMILSGHMLPGSRLALFFHSTGSQNHAGINEPELDRLIEGQARELDAEKRKKMMHDIQRILYQKSYTSSTIEFAQIAAWQSFVNNYVFNYGASAYAMWPRDMWLDVDRMPKGRTLD